MNNKPITIITDLGASYGYGHIQRMTTLLHYLIYEKKINCLLQIKNLPEFFPENLKEFVSSEIPESTSLIIRDKRDSTRKEMENLKSVAPLIAIDDLGEGRMVADSAVDLLPNLEYDYHDDLKDIPFIQGYNFFSSINQIDGDFIEKKYDFLIYTGGKKDYIEEIISSIIPDESKTVFIDGKSQIFYENRSFKEININYGELLLSSRRVISHFGILLFEAFLSGCSIITINPTEYHSRLTDISKNLLNLTNMGVYPIDYSQMKKNLQQNMKNMDVDYPPVNVKFVKEQITKSLDSFYTLIENFIK